MTAYYIKGILFLISSLRNYLKTIQFLGVLYIYINFSVHFVAFSYNFHILRAYNAHGQLKIAFGSIDPSWLRLLEKFFQLSLLYSQFPLCIPGLRVCNLIKIHYPLSMQVGFSKRYCQICRLLVHGSIFSATPSFKIFSYLSSSVPSSSVFENFS